MRKSRVLLSILVLAAAGAAVAAAEDFGQAERRNLLSLEVADLPGKAVIGGGERLIRPGGRSPWHTADGPKLLYVLEGTMAVEGLPGHTVLTCGPAPKLCYLNPHKASWFFHNVGSAPLKFLVIGIDPVGRPTIHEEVGQVTRIFGEQVTLALGDIRASDLAVPRREVTITVSELGPITVGDDVVTVRYNEKAYTAERLVKLGRRWR